MAPISLSEVLNYDARLPRHVQLNLDYTSPDLVMDGNLTVATDMFSLGLLILALYNSPHRSPLEFNGSQSAYKRAFSSSSSVPNKTNNFMCSQPLPKEVINGVLDRLITRRPAQRLDAREFQQAQYFDNLLVSTMRFLDELPAKTPNEKSQFMRGLPRILNQFPKSVLEKKVLPALLEETKDRELLALVLQNVFKIISMLPSGKRAFTEKVIPKLRETFLSSPPAKGAAPERDSLKEAGLMVLLENMNVAARNSSGKEFKDGKLPCHRTLLPTNVDRHTPDNKLRFGVICPFCGRCCSTDFICRFTYPRLLNHQERALSHYRTRVCQDEQYGYQNSRVGSAENTVRWRERGTRWFSFGRSYRTCRTCKAKNLERVDSGQVYHPRKGGTTAQRHQNEGARSDGEFHLVYQTSPLY